MSICLYWYHFSTTLAPENQLSNRAFYFAMLHNASVKCLNCLIFFVNFFYSLHELLDYFSISSGANKSVYAPEPFDVGRILQADIVSNGQKVTLITAGPIGPGRLFSKFFVFLSYIFITLVY